MRKCSTAVLFFCCSLAIAQQTLSNDSIAKMAKAGLSDDLIVSTINASPGKFDVTTDGLIALKRGGVSDKVVLGSAAQKRPEIHCCLIRIRRLPPIRAYTDRKQ